MSLHNGTAYETEFKKYLEHLGHYVFGTGRFECEAPDPDLIVRAWPLKYAGNFRLEDEFTREMRYGDADRSSMSFFPGVIKDGKVL